MNVSYRRADGLSRQRLAPAAVQQRCESCCDSSDCQIRTFFSLYQQLSMPTLYIARRTRLNEFKR